MLNIKKIKQRLKQTYLFNVFVAIRNISRVFYSTKSRSRFLWNLKKGDEILSLNYLLNQDSFAFVIGAFEGNYLEKLNNKYKCNIYAFEPVPKYFEILKSKFYTFNNVKLFNYGLSDRDETVDFFVDNESSSLFKDSNINIPVKMTTLENIVENDEISVLDFIYMNIEGGEYKVLNSFIDSGLIKKIKYLQIQFHEIDANSKDLRKHLRKKLSKTHHCVYNFPFIWERWDSKTLL